MNTQYFMWFDDGSKATGLADLATTSFPFIDLALWMSL
jgi:hypothetical protein